MKCKHVIVRSNKVDCADGFPVQREPGPNGREVMYVSTGAGRMYIAQSAKPNGRLYHARAHYDQHRNFHCLAETPPDKETSLVLLELSWSDEVYLLDTKSAPISCPFRGSTMREEGVCPLCGTPYQKATEWMHPDVGRTNLPVPLKMASQLDAGILATQRRGQTETHLLRVGPGIRLLVGARSVLPGVAAWGMDGKEAVVEL